MAFGEVGRIRDDINSHYSHYSTVEMLAFYDTITSITYNMAETPPGIEVAHKIHRQPLAQRIFKRPLIDKNPHPIPLGRARKAVEASGIELQEGQRPEALNRQLMVRYERYQMLQTYEYIRSQIQKATTPEDKLKWRDTLNQVRPAFGRLQENLDFINYQNFHNNVDVAVDTPELGRHTVRMAELDIHKGEYKDGEDPRIPYIFIGGIGTNRYQTTAFTYMLAAAGERVLVFTYPDQKMADAPADWNDRLKALPEGQGFKLHAELLKQVINDLKVPEVNLLAYSMGGGIAATAAADPSFDKIHDLIIMEPVGFEKRSLLGIGWDFGVNLGVRMNATGESKIKNHDIGVEPKPEFKDGSFMLLTNILHGQQITPEEISQAHPRGKFQVWVGEDSPINNADKTQDILLAENNFMSPNQARAQVHRIKGGDHVAPITMAMGIVNEIRKPQRAESVVTYRKDQLERSATEAILRGNFPATV